MKVWGQITKWIKSLNVLCQTINQASLLNDFSSHLIEILRTENYIFCYFAWEERFCCIIFSQSSKFGLMSISCLYSWDTVCMIVIKYIWFDEKPKINKTKSKVKHPYKFPWFRYYTIKDKLQGVNPKLAEIGVKDIKYDFESEKIGFIFDEGKS